MGEQRKYSEESGVISKRSLLVTPALILSSRRLARAQRLLLLGAGTSSSIDSNAIIVAPSTGSPAGNDSNTGTLAAPVASLERAQALVRRSSVTKTVYLRAGTYSRTGRLVLTSSDNGGTWATYPFDPVNSAILDYTNASFDHSVRDLFSSAAGSCVQLQGTTGITISGLQIQNYPAIGILIYGGSGTGFGTASARAGSNNTIENCYFLNGNGGGPPFYAQNDGQNATNGNGIYSTESPAIWVLGKVDSTMVQHNAVLNHMSTTLLAQNGATNTTIRNNYIQNANIAGFDTGCIYTQQITGVTITCNYMRDGKSFSSAYSLYDRDVRAIYCDAGSNNILATLNIIAGAAADTSGHSGGAPSYGMNDDAFKAFMFGQGSNANQHFKYNIFDMGTTGHIVVQNSSTGSGNEFVGNIIISNFFGNPPSPSFGSWHQSYSSGSSKPSAFTNGPNQYYNYGGGSTYTSGHTNGNPVVSDSNPQTGDPRISGWNYLIDPSSPVFSSPINFATLPLGWGQPGFWGPPGFTVPETGTGSIPSCPLLE
jgi:hypothetical protein